MRTPRHATHAAQQPGTGTVVMLGLIVCLLASGVAHALWNASAPGAGQINIGETRFAVGNPPGEGAPLPAPYSSTWALPTAGFGVTTDPLSEDETFATVVQLDGVADGDRAMTYSLQHVTVSDPEATGLYAQNLNTVIFPVPSPEGCTSQTDPPATALYEGPLDEATLKDQPLIPKTGPRPTTVTTLYLCLLHTLDLATNYTNTATVTGHADHDVADPVAVSAQDSWHATITPPDGALRPEVTFAFSHQTTRLTDDTEGGA